MWICPLCHQKFIKTHQVHSCNDKVLADFFNGKSEETIALFWYFVQSYQKIGKVTVHPAKSMIGLAADTRIAYVTRLGKNFVDVVFPFRQAYPENLCFHKIAQVPGDQQYNHHLRLFSKNDVNPEVKKFMKFAYSLGKK